MFQLRILRSFIRNYPEVSGLGVRRGVRSARHEMEVTLRDPSIWPDRGEIVNNSLHAGTRTTTPLITSCMEGSHLTLTQHYQGRAGRG